MSRYQDPSSSNRPDPELEARQQQLRQLYGFDFPPELFDFWRWYHRLDEDDRRTFGGTLGMGLAGPYDVLRGRFDDVDLVYPAVLHWRFGGDPAEFVTVLTGDTDGLHWGYWFDHHGALPPVVSAWYARDAFELWQAGDTLFDAVRNHLQSQLEGARENLEYDPGEAEHYHREIAAMQRLARQLPPARTGSDRRPTHRTADGMGIVAGGAPDAAVQKLLEGKQLWADGKKGAFDVLIEAYEAMGRPVLAAIARAHRDNPALPSVDIVRYERGHCDDLDKALADPTAVRKLELVRRGLTALPDLSALVNLRHLSVPSNQLTGLPASLASCSRLQKLNLWNNQLAALPEALFDLPDLRELAASQNPIRALPAAVGRCQNLEVLELMSTELTALPESIGRLTALRELNVAGCKLTALPDSIGDLSSITRLALHKNQLTDLPDLSRLTALKDLGLTGNPLPDPVIQRVRAQLPQATIQL